MGSLRRWLANPRIRLFAVLCVLVIVAGLFAGPAESANKPCCLDEWQGGGICPPGQRVASYCTDGCSTCGMFFCYSGLCLR